MSVAEKLNKINNIKEDIKAALQYKGLTVTDQFDTYADQIRSIGATNYDNPFKRIGYKRGEETSFIDRELDKGEEILANWNPDKTSFTGSNIMFYPQVDTSKVTTMNSAFKNMTNLYTVGLLDTRKVTNMGAMFYGCSNLVTIPPFDVKEVTTTASMFYSCKALQSIPALDTIRVTTMSYMFYDCPLISAIPSLITDTVTDMSYMFSKCTGLNKADMRAFNFGYTTTLASMFEDCSNLTEIDFTGSDFSNVSTWTNITKNCSNLTKVDLTNCKISNGFRFSNILGEKVYNNLDTSALTHTKYLFTDPNKNKVDISNFDLSNVTDMSYTFSGNTSNSIILGNVDTSKVTNMSFMFNGCNKITHLDLSGLDVSKVTNMANIFYNCTSLNTIDTTGWNTENLTSLNSAFYYVPADINISHWNTSKVTDINYMFQYYNGSSIVLDNLDLSKVTAYSSMWSNMSTSITLSLNNTKLFNGFKVAPKATSVSLNNTMGYLVGMFNGCTSLTQIDLSNYKMYSDTTSLGSTFYGCTGLTSIDISVLDTSNIKTMSSTFYGCTKLTEVKIGNTSNVTTMESMFYNCSKLVSIKGDLLGSTNKSGIFYNCSNLVDTGKIDLTGITSTSSYYLWGSSTTSYMPSKLRKATFINIGDASTAYGLHFTNWGVEDVENYPTSAGARQSLIDSLITYSKTRETTCTIYLSKNTLAVLTEDEINQINAKGYTLVQK